MNDKKLIKDFEETINLGVGTSIDDGGCYLVFTSLGSGVNYKNRPSLDLSLFIDNSQTEDFNKEIFNIEDGLLGEIELIQNIQTGKIDKSENIDAINYLNSMSDFSMNILTGENCSNILEEKVRSGEFLFGIIIPEGFSKRINDLQQSRLEVLYDNTDPGTSTMVMWRIDSALAPFQQEIVKLFANEIKIPSTLLFKSNSICFFSKS